MRLSANKSDPGYRPDVFKYDIEVYCDGALVESCETADEEEGFAIFLTGKSVGGHGEEIERVTVRGKVEIRGFPLDI